MPTAVDYDPFTVATLPPEPRPASGVPVDHDPFKSAGPSSQHEYLGDFIDALDSARTATLKGFSNVAGLPGFIGDLAGHGLDAAASKMMGKETKFPRLPIYFPTAPEIQEGIFNKIPEYKPKNTSEDFAQSTLEGVTSVAASGGLSLIPMLTGAASQDMGNLGQRMFPDKPWVSFLMSLIPPAGVAGAKRLFPSVPSTVKTALRDTGPAALDDAARVQAAGRKIGVPVTGPEALNNPSLLRLQQLVEQSEMGQKVRDIIAARPDAQRAAVLRHNQGMGELPPRMAAESIKSAADTTIKKAEGARSQAVKPFYESASRSAIDAKALDPLLADIDGALARVGAQSQIGKELASYRHKIVSTVQADQGTAGVGPLDTIYKEIRSRAMKSPVDPNALDKEVAGILRPLNHDLGDILTRGNADLAYGRSTYQAMTPPIADLKASQIGALARQKAPTIEGQANILLDSKSTRPDQVTKTLRALNRADPEAAPNFIRNYVENTLDEATKRLAQGPTDNVGGRFYSAIAGTPNAQANLRAAFNTLPNGTDRWNAFATTLKVFEANARRLPVGSPTVDKKLLVDALTPGSVARPLNSAADWWGKLRYGRNMGKLAELFARSDSIEEMRRIAGFAATDPKALATVRVFVNSEPKPGEKAK